MKGMVAGVAMGTDLEANSQFQALTDNLGSHLQHEHLRCCKSACEENGGRSGNGIDPGAQWPVSGANKFWAVRMLQ